MIAIDLLENNGKADISGNMEVVKSEMMYLIGAYYKKLSELQGRDLEASEILKDLGYQLGLVMEFFEKNGKQS